MTLNHHTHHFITTASLFTALTGLTSAVVVSVPATEDTTLFSNAITNNGGGHSFLISGIANNGNERRSLFQFDASLSVPLGSTINSVTLNLSVSQIGNAGGTFNLLPLTGDWGEGVGTGNQGSAAMPNEATWTASFTNGTNWSTPGGDFLNTTLSSSSITSVGTASFLTSPSFVSTVQSMVDNPANDFGFILTSSDPGSAIRIGSIEGGSPASLTIDFTPIPEPSTLSLFALGAGLAFRRRR